MQNQTTSFWHYLQQHAVEIPIIQRDYAQGREGKEYLRKVFLANLKQALDHKLPNNEPRLKLDFVYGSMEDGKLKPLDGQQRLTTLWLLHWYIALRAGKLAEACPILKNFTYETRISSREFCKRLCDDKEFASYSADKQDIYDYITSRTWFYTAWKQDPTIRSMLRMLSGSVAKKHVRREPSEEMADGLEKLFKNSDPFGSYWDALISDTPPIVFYQLPLETFGLSDDLYIKMNARGKQLTAFENFKADLIGYMRDQTKAETASKAEWEALLDAKNGIPIKLDTVWTDLFWKELFCEPKSADNQFPECHIDAIFFAFINRFFWNELFIAKSGDAYLLPVGNGVSANGEKTATIENESPAYRYLNLDPVANYEGLSPYKYCGGEIPLQLFKDLQTILDRYAAFSDTIPVAPWDTGFAFIPKYESAASNQALTITTLNQIQRIIFFAVCKYLKEGDVDLESLKRWMRVVYNLISGEDEHGRPQIRSTEAVRKAVQLLDKLDSHHVYESLKKQPIITGNTDYLEQRWNEEIHKVRQLLNDDNTLKPYDGSSVQKNGSTYSTWEDIIIETEQFSFFKGAIRFLFQNENEDGTPDWKLFDRKWKNAQTYFEQKTDDNGEKSKLTRANADLLKSLISKFSQEHFDMALYDHRTFNNEPSTWLYYLLHKHLHGPVHQFLIDEQPTITDLSPDKEHFQQNTLYLLSNTKLLDYVFDNLPNSLIHKYKGRKAFFPSSTRIFLDADHRDTFLNTYTEVAREIKVCDIKRDVKDASEIEVSALFFGNDINFKFEGKNYQWYRDDTIYLMQDSDPNVYVERDPDQTSESERYYCFSANAMPYEEIKSNLKQLQDKEKNDRERATSVEQTVR